MKLKEKHSKLDKLTYTQLKLQPYLSSRNITITQKELLYLLRSHCYYTKINFQKLNKNYLKCGLGCLHDEDQSHVFTNCNPILKHFEDLRTIQYNLALLKNKSQH